MTLTIATVVLLSGMTLLLVAATLVVVAAGLSWWHDLSRPAGRRRPPWETRRDTHPEAPRRL